MAIDLSRWEVWLVLVLSLLVLTLALYLAMRLITGRKKLDGGYFLRLFLVSIILLVGVVAIAQALAALTFNLGPVFYVLLTIGFILVIRYLLTTPAVIPYQAASAEKYWQWSLWITLISLVIFLAIIYAVYYISSALGNPIDLIGI